MYLFRIVKGFDLLAYLREIFLWFDLVGAVGERIHYIDELFWVLKEFEISIHHGLDSFFLGLKFSNDMPFFFWYFFFQRFFIDLDPLLEHGDRLSPKVDVNLVSAKELKFIFPLLEVSQLFLQRIPESYAVLGGQIVRLQVLRDFHEINYLIVEGELFYLV